jgi:hypothetical protein
MKPTHVTAQMLDKTCDEIADRTPPGDLRIGFVEQNMVVAMFGVQLQLAVIIYFLKNCSRDCGLKGCFF